LKKDSSSSSGGVDLTKADEKLQEALIQFPMVLQPLLAKCNVNITKGEWAQLFAAKEGSQLWSANVPKILQALISVFVERNFSLWKVDAVQKWLRLNVTKLLTRNDLTVMCQEAEAIRKREWAEMPNTELYRYLLLSEVPGAISALPQDARVFRMYDALHFDNRDTVSARTSNPLALFLQTLMPWQPVPNGPPMPAGGAAGGGGGGGLPQFIADALGCVRGGGAGGGAAGGGNRDGVEEFPVEEELD